MMAMDVPIRHLTTTPKRGLVVLSIVLLVGGAGACSERGGWKPGDVAKALHTTKPVTIEGKDGNALLHFDDDIVTLEGVEFEGAYDRDIPVSSNSDYAHFRASDEKGSWAWEKIDVGWRITIRQITFDVLQDGKRIRWGGRTADLSGGPKLITFPKEGPVKIREKR